MRRFLLILVTCSLLTCSLVGVGWSFELSTQLELKAVVRAEPANLSGRSLDFFKYRSVWCMAIGWMCFNTVFYGLLTWMPNYLAKVHGFDIKQMGGAVFIMFFSTWFTWSGWQPPAPHVLRATRRSPGLTNCTYSTVSCSRPV